MTFVYCTLKFEGFHRWKDAPESVAFLRDWHRHLFGVRVQVRVSHDDRDVEFITLKHLVEGYVESRYARQQFDKSCEMIAREIGEWLQSQTRYEVSSVQVDEDGENGAVVIWA